VTDLNAIEPSFARPPAASCGCVLWLLVAEALGNGGTEYHPPLLDIPNRLAQKAGGGLFEQISCRAPMLCLLDVGVIIVGGEDVVNDNY
jgi:hypothetical protein